MNISINIKKIKCEGTEKSDLCGNKKGYPVLDKTK